MLASLAQFKAGTDKDENLKVATALIEGAAASGARLVVLPENAMYANDDRTADIRPDTEPVDGPFSTAMAALARKYHLTIVAGMTEAPSDPEDKATNAVLVVNENGTLEGVYRKAHLYDAFGYRESDRVQAHAPQALIFTSEGITFGVMTCYDIRFPEMARFLVDAGAEAIIVPAAWVAGPAKEDHWATLVRARAIENTVYVLGAGMTGPTCIGQSVIVDPMGTVIGAAGEEPGVATAVLTAGRVAQVRATNPCLDNRRFHVVAN